MHRYNLPNAAHWVKSTALLAAVTAIVGLAGIGISGAAPQAGPSEVSHGTVVNLAAPTLDSPPVRAGVALTTTKLYLPVFFALGPNLFGVTMSPVGSSGGLGLVQATNTQWTRGPFVEWDIVEPSPGVRNWSAVAGTETQIRAAAQNNLTLILSVNRTPAWAQKVPGYACGPVAANQMGAFAAFMHDVVARYSVAPYNVKYFEMWNEPDVDHSQLSDPNSLFGCWGDKSDAYYGGGYYGQMLSQVVPQMRAANASIQVLVGGLLLDCDPVHPPAGKNCNPSKFLEGILRSGAAPYFDAISFHAYDYYAGALGHYFNPNWNSAWNTTGPVTRVKLNFLRSVLAAYGVSNKPLLNTESALLCFAAACDNGGNANFVQTKADYLAEVFAEALADGLRANVWYSMAGWHNSDLMSAGGLPNAAYVAYKFSAQQLGGAGYLRTLGAFPGLTGYEFRRGGQRVWVLWSSDGGSHVASLLGTPVAIYAVDGTALALTSSLSVGVQPRYVVWQP